MNMEYFKTSPAIVRVPHVLVGAVVATLSQVAAVEPSEALELRPAPQLAPSQEELAQQKNEKDFPQGNAGKAQHFQLKEAAPAPAAQNPEVQNEVAWLGVMSFPIDDMIAAQLGIEGGVALQVVSEDSPAALSGLKVHDIITHLDGQPINDHLALRKMIHAKEAGAAIQIDVISRGEKKKLNAQLVGRPQQGRAPFNGNRLGFQKRLSDQLRGLGMGNDGNGFQDQLEELMPLLEGFDERMMRDQLQDLQGHFQKMNREGFEGLGRMLEEGGAGDLKGLNLKLQQLLQNAAPILDDAFGGLSSNIRIQDDEGVVEITAVDGSKELTIKDRAGNILYAGPYNTEEDFTEVPDDLRHRVKQLDFDGNKSLKLRMRNLPKNGAAQPVKE